MFHPDGEAFDARARGEDALRKALEDEPEGYEHFLENLHRVVTAFTPEQDAAIRALVEAGDKLAAQRAILDTLKGEDDGQTNQPS